MKKIEKLKIDDLCKRFIPLTEDEIKEMMGGWYCFSYCMNYIGADGNLFQHYYDNIYGSAESGGGVSNWYIEGALSYAGIGYNNYNGVGLSSITPNGRQIVVINNGTHAVIYEGYYRDTNGNHTVNYYDPQTGSSATYTIGANEEFGMIGF
jgi:hypothetical protein